jgi:hypothetical protein
MGTHLSNVSLCGAVITLVFFASVGQVESQSARGGPIGLIEEVAKLKAQVEELQRGASPVGSIIAFAGMRSSLPGTWVPCDGRALPQNEYRELFAVVHGGYGDNGSGTFRIPNLNGRFLLGDLDKKESDGAWIQRSSDDGLHQHDIEEIPKHKVTKTSSGFPPLPVTVEEPVRRWFGDDNPDNQFRNKADGLHHHSVPIKPPYTTAVYIIRVK